MYCYFINSLGVLKMLKHETPINTELNRNVTKMTPEQEAFWEAHPDASVYQVKHCYMPEDNLDSHKRAKIREIDAYDTSDNVNGFFYNGNFMWLDKATRVGLVNSLNSARTMGADSIDIWYGSHYITLDIDEAELMLADLENYAMRCYNVTALHKVQVEALQTIEEVDAFDVTSNYPPRPQYPINMENL